MGCSMYIHDNAFPGMPHDAGHHLSSSDGDECLKIFDNFFIITRKFQILNMFAFLNILLRFLAYFLKKKRDFLQKFCAMI